VLPAPIGYNVSGQHNYYFSHMLNCIYDCRYCFLQGMYRSAHQVLFINYENFIDEIKRVSAQHGDEAAWFFSGYDCDSLAYEPVTHFIDYHLPEFETILNAWLEIRTKSTQIRQLLKHPASERVVVAFSFTDQATYQHSEHQVPSIQKRIDAMLKLADAGWKLGLRFDPVIYHRDYQAGFTALLKTLFEQLPLDQLHSVSLGSFRLPKQNFKIMHDLYPQEKIFNQAFELNKGMYSYPAEIESSMMAFCESALLQYIPQSIYFPCRW
jgi:spore photoproduct lyase